MADRWGVDDGYWDIAGTWHDTPDDVRAALRSAMGEPELADPVWFVRHGSAPPVDRPADVVLEDGTHVAVGGALPPDLPLGYHDLHPSDGGSTTRLIVVPDRCAPSPVRSWGLSVQLYAARSRSSWGIGDLGDLATLGRWAAGAGAGFVVLSPLHAPIPEDAPEPSPYFASSRRWRNPLHLRTDATPELAAAGRALNDDRRIDRREVWALKRAALASAWEDGRSRIGADPGFVAFREHHGRPLERYATFCALAEHHGARWPAWPTEHQHPDSPSVARFAAAHRDAVAFHAWIQWLLDRQLAAAAEASPGLVHDLAIGADPEGADAWLWQDVLAGGVRVGAPPDEFNGAGQDWGLPPFVPWRLRAARYEPFVELLRAVFAHGAGIRVDHVMGLFRLWWIPESSGAAEGGYVRFAGQELLDLLVLESARAGAYVVGEDLGTVEDEVRHALAERDVLSYRLAWFEPDPPERWPEQALAALTTHDLPTLAGVASGHDDAGGKLGGRLDRFLGGDRPSGAVELAGAAHCRLAAASCRLVSATLDDALGVEERPNEPGTTAGERPNWSIALPVPLDDVPAHPGVRAVVGALHEGRPAAD